MIRRCDDVLVVDEPGTRINYGLNRVRFITPVLEGRDVRLGAVIASVTPAGEGWQLILDVTMELRDATSPLVSPRCCTGGTRREQHPLPTGDEKTRAVRTMFDAIAGRYEMVNRLIPSVWTRAGVVVR